MPRKKKSETEKAEKEEAKKKLLEKAKEIEKKIEVKEEKKQEEKSEEKKTADEKREIKSEWNTLVPLETYIKAGSYIGTKVIMPNMRQFVYKRRNDGIAIINTNVIDEKLREAIKFISSYKPEDWILVCKREAGWRAAKLFSELTGVRAFTKKYPAGIITNIALPNFFETEMVFICDPWLDKNALNDTINVKKQVVGICDTNNLSNGINVVIPANNKSSKSLGLILWIIAREYIKARGIDKKIPDVEEFIGEKLEELPMKEKKRKREREEERKEDIAKIESIMKVSEE